MDNKIIRGVRTALVIAVAILFVAGFLSFIFHDYPSACFSFATSAILNWYNYYILGGNTHGRN